MNLNDIDFTIADDIAGSATLLTTVARNSGQRHTATAREWLRNVETVLPSLSPGDALTVADSYEAVCKLAYTSSPATSIPSGCRMNAFEALINGDRSVNRYRLRSAISREIDRRNPRFFGKPLQWESVCIDHWYRQFQYGVSLEDLSDYDTINRVATLLTSDLWAFETRNENKFKQNLFENHRHYLDAMPDADAIQHTQSIKHNSEEYSLLIANSSLLTASAPYLTPEEYSSYDSRIRTLLIASPSTNRFHREALRRSITD